MSAASHVLATRDTRLKSAVLDDGASARSHDIGAKYLSIA